MECRSDSTLPKKPHSKCHDTFICTIHSYGVPPRLPSEDKRNAMTHSCAPRLILISNTTHWHVRHIRHDLFICKTWSAAWDRSCLECGTPNACALECGPFVCLNTCVGLHANKDTCVRLNEWVSCVCACVRVCVCACVRVCVCVCACVAFPTDDAPPPQKKQE